MYVARHRVASSALGEREEVHVLLYSNPDDLRRAAEHFNGNSNDGAVGLTQAWADDLTDRTTAVIVRLARGHLGTRVVGHELHHATTALYGAHVGDRISRRAHLNHYNEPFAHLYSDMLGQVVDWLYSIGEYNSTASR